MFILLCGKITPSVSNSKGFGFNEKRSIINNSRETLGNEKKEFLQYLAKQTNLILFGCVRTEKAVKFKS